MAMQVAGKRFAIAALAGAALMVGATSADAGLLDQLFGGFLQQAPAPQPEPGYPTAQPASPGADSIRAHRVRKKVVVADTTPNLQKATDLMSDKTLRYGDVVMMKSGLHVYTGLGSSHHDSNEFVALGEIHHMSKQQRGELTAMDMTRRAPLNYVASNSVQEGRSAADGPVVAQGYKITDARGRSIRYVGP